MSKFMVKQDDLKRFWSKVDICGEDECWKWLGSMDGRGYGKFFVHGKYFIASRLAWILSNRDIPEGMCILHHCDNPPCVNPNHLWLGTYKDNTQDALRKGRLTNRGGGRKPGLYLGKYKLNNPQNRRGENHCRSKLLEDEVRKIRELYNIGGFTQTELAKMFGVTQGSIRDVVTKRSWAWLS